jgi:hypothetical protein
VDGPEHLLLSGAEASSIIEEEGASIFHGRPMDPLQTQLVCREVIERGHSEEVARMLEAEGGGAGLGGEAANFGSRREEKEG